MANLTLAIPADLRAKMNQFPDINWSAVARHAIIEKMQLLERLDKMMAKSTLTEADAIALGRLVKQRMWRRHYARK